MTQTLAKEFGGRNIRVNAVCPGFIQTAMTQDLANIPNKATVFFIDNKKIICDNQENLKKQNKNYIKLIDICNNIVGELYE